MTADLATDDLTKDRHENLRRVGEMARMTMEARVITLTAFTSPFEEDRARVRDIVGPENLFEMYVRCPLAMCETREVEGLYRKARQGEISHFTGVSAPYEEPTSAHLVLDTSVLSANECARRMLESQQPRLALPGG